MVEANLFNTKLYMYHEILRAAAALPLGGSPELMQPEALCSLLKLSPNSGSHQKRDPWFLTAQYGTTLTPVLSPKLTPSVYHNSTVPAQLGE